MTLIGIFSGVFLFLPFSNIVYSEKIVTTSKDIKLLPTLPQQLNKTLLIASEGGPLTNTTVTLPKENNSMVINLDTDLVKNKTNSVVPRKGVKYHLTSNEQDSLSSGDMITLDESSNLTNTLKPISNNSGLQIEEKNNKSIVHKPTVLSSQILDKLSENLEFQPDAKVKKMHDNSHPDLVMPIVITILVVPMFAVVGYMALKRGQEAWKNRHYKRMDFLLDGMYND
ncbi:uncharacterized protein LOC110992878 [Pieris rapae]|uniref:uncharacterized protein LOC110992878 n=1 Tax=Pieris rapae TaxID=64459 RepID=UPI001E27D2FA|nr:uncharacterized protein LOC110992878 [Pieris rapae]